MSHSYDFLTHRVEGEGAPILLLNGIGMTIPGWQLMIRELTGRYRVIRCDFRGQLLSPGSVPENSEDHAHDIKRLLDFLGIDSVHIIGTSFGGMVAVLLAALYPDTVESMTIVASADTFDKTMNDEVTRWIHGAEHVLKTGEKQSFADVLNSVIYSERYRKENKNIMLSRKKLYQNLPDRWFSDLVLLIKSAQARDLNGYLRQICCPVQVVAAEYDGFIPLERCRALAEGIPEAQFRILAQAGHAAVIEKPGKVAALVDSFLNK